MRAIVVDDSPSMRSLIKAQLSRLGYSVVGEGENGVEAIELVRSLKPDLMTLDIIMPEMDGIECYRHVRQMEHPPHTLLVSVLAVEPRIIKAYEGEIYSSHFLKKPFTDKDFKEKVELVMSTGAMPYPQVEKSQEEENSEAPPPPPGAPSLVPPLPNN